MSASESPDLGALLELEDLDMMTGENVAVAYEYDLQVLASVAATLADALQAAEAELVEECEAVERHNAETKRRQQESSTYLDAKSAVEATKEALGDAKAALAAAKQALKDAATAKSVTHHAKVTAETNYDLVSRHRRPDQAALARLEGQRQRARREHNAKLKVWRAAKDDRDVAELRFEAAMSAQAAANQAWEETRKHPPSSEGYGSIEPAPSTDEVDRLRRRQEAVREARRLVMQRALARKAAELEARDSPAEPEQGPSDTTEKPDLAPTPK